MACRIGVHVSQVHRWEETGYWGSSWDLCWQAGKTIKNMEKERDKLYQRNRSITGRTRLVKKNYWASGVSPAWFKRLLYWISTWLEISISRQCDLIRLPRSSFYRLPKKNGESQENLNIMRIIDEEYTAHPFYGSRKMRDVLRRRGIFSQQKTGTAVHAKKWGFSQSLRNLVPASRIPNTKFILISWEMWIFVVLIMYGHRILLMYLYLVVLCNLGRYYWLVQPICPCLGRFP